MLSVSVRIPSHPVRQVYLRSLPVLTTTTHTASPSNSSLAHFSRTPSMLGMNQRPYHHQPTKHLSRHLFFASDVDAIARNADQILELHEHLVQQLRAAVSQYGFSMQLDVNDTPRPSNVQRAIDAVSAIFVDHVNPLSRSLPMDTC